MRSSHDLQDPDRAAGPGGARRPWPPTRSPGGRARRRSSRCGDVYRDYAREHPGRYAAARYRLDPETAAASAGVRHAQLTRAVLRGYDLSEPGPDPRRPTAGQHVPRLRQPGAGRRLQPQRPRPRRRPGRGSSTPSTPCCDWQPGRPHMTDLPLTDGSTRSPTSLRHRGRPASSSAPRAACCPTGCPHAPARQADDPQLAMAESQPSGVRLALPHPGHRRRAGRAAHQARATSARRRGRTASTTCSSTASSSARRSAPGGDTLDHRHGDRVRRARRPARPATLRFDGLPGDEKDVEIWLPHDETTELVALRTDAPVEPVPARRPQGLAAPRQLDQPRLRRRQPDRAPGPPSPPPSAASTWSTSASAAAPCSTRSPPARCATPPPT